MIFINGLKKAVRELYKMSPDYLTTMSVLIGSYTILTLAFLFQQNINQYLTHWGQDIKLNVYLQNDASKKDVGIVEEFLNQTGQFSTISFISKSQAAEKFKNKVGHYAPGLLSDIEFDNPLPASFEIELLNGVKTQKKFNEILSLVEDLKKMKSIEDVSYGQGWVENYASVLNVFTVTSYSFILVLLAGSLFVIGNSVRNSLNQRMDEIEILELFGATKKDIILPFIFEGLLMGFVASLASVALAYSMYLWQIDVVAEELSFWNLKANLTFLSFNRICSVISIGTLLGGLGSYLWIRKVATGWAAAEATKK